MRHQLNPSIVILSVLLLLGLVPGEHTSAAREQDASLSPAGVLSSPLFPCSTCHAGLETNAQKRLLSFHAEMKIQGHGEPQRWCLDCHNAVNRDALRLLNGDAVKFSESYLLCGQCHGNILRAWKAGIHGKRTGMWDGPKRYLLCTACHNPHSPRFKPLKPDAAPLRPAQTLRR